MDERQEAEAYTDDIEFLLELIDVRRCYFDTAYEESLDKYVCRPGEIFGYQFNERSQFDADRLDSGPEIYQKILAMDESRSNDTEWEIEYHQPHRPVDDSIRVQLSKEYGEALEENSLNGMELEAGVFRVEGDLDPEKISLDELDKKLE